MYEIGLAAPKGGVGKSTLAWNLAWYWYLQGLKVCIADTDKQHSLVDLAKDSNAPFPVYTAVPKNRDFDVCVIDHPPAQDTNIRGDVIVYPMAAHNFDVKAFARAKPNFGNRKMVTVVNKFKIGNKNQKAYGERMKKENGAIWIKQRTVFEDSTNSGIYVGDVKSSRVRHQAADEIGILAQRVEICLS